MIAESNVKERFLKDIKNHKLKVLKDDGVYRHIELSDGSPYYRFEIMSFPNHLVYVGDMGSYTFVRSNDMFNFFRSKELEINSGYWAEKCIAEAVSENGIREFSVEEFRETVRSYVDSRLEDEVELEEEIELTDAIIEDYELEDLLSADNEWECYSAFNDYSGKLGFEDFWESSCMRKTHHFIWCLYALVFAIQKYDEYKLGVNKK